MDPAIRSLPAYQVAVDALQALANATGSAWIITNLPLDIEDERLAPPVIADPDQLCLLCGRVH